MPSLERVKDIFKHICYDFLSEKELEGHNDLQEEAAIMNTQHRYAG